jgi:transposase
MDARCAESGEKAEKNRVKPLRSLVPWRRPWYFRIMTPSCESLPSDPALLTELALALRAENESLRTTISTLKALIFGARSEKFSTIAAEQLALALGEGNGDAPSDPSDLDASAKASKTPRKKAVRNIGKLPEHLPRSERVIEPATTQCPCCNGKMHRIGEDVSETLDRVPATLRVLRTIRPKYACRACESGVTQAPAPARLIEGGMASTALVAQIAVAKYAWLSTLYRQTLILAGQGVVLDRQTLARWMKQAAWMLEGLYELQLATMHRCPRLFCDETPMPVLAPRHVKTCQFWAHATDDRAWSGPAPPAVAYVFAGSRGKKEIAAQLSGFEGILQVDGYAAYKALVKDADTKSRVTLAFCLAHARRNFVRVFKTTRSPFAEEVIERIAAVYAIEKRIRGKTEELRKAVRQAETKPLMEGLHARLLAVREGLSQIAPLTKAINYMLAHWSGLTRFLDDGRIEPDTNIVERPIRFIAIGKKNSLFCGDEGGGRTWAILSTLLQTARLNEVDPEVWLVDVLERVVSCETTNDRLAELLAWNWKAAREQAKLAA